MKIVKGSAVLLFLSLSVSMLLISGCNSSSPDNETPSSGGSSSSLSAGYDLVNQQIMVHGIVQFIAQFQQSFDDRSQSIDDRLLLVGEYDTLDAVDDWTITFDVELQALLARVKSRIILYTELTNIDPDVINSTMDDLAADVVFYFETKFSLRFMGNAEQLAHLNADEFIDSINSAVDTALVEINAE